ncbi:MAG: PEP-CTERM sorting domain-containing protein [Rhodospirillaceae bacterium]|jgi:hypothetical protein|nr:PEP-CTERM sorting domain-containing protein [Rhodospirillaceae bacterium]
MKKLLISLALLSALFVWDNRAHAVPINCIICGNTPLIAPGVDGTISFAVISGTDFNNELAAHGIGFFGAVPGGTLDAVPDVTAATDFVYLYQLVNDGQDPTPVSSYEVSLGIPQALLTGGGRLESTLFVDPVLGTVSAGPAGGTTALSPGPTVDFLNGLGLGGFGPCQSSGPPGFNCSDATANLFAGKIQATNFAEAPAAPDLDPFWTSSIMWYSTPVGPGTGIASVFGVTGASASGAVPTAVPEPGPFTLLGIGFVGLGLMRRRRKAA